MQHEWKKHLLKKNIFDENIKSKIKTQTTKGVFSI